MYNWPFNKDLKWNIRRRAVCFSRLWSIFVINSKHVHWIPMKKKKETAQRENIRFELVLQKHSPKLKERENRFDSRRERRATPFAVRLTQCVSLCVRTKWATTLCSRGNWTTLARRNVLSPFHSHTHLFGTATERIEHVLAARAICPASRRCIKHIFRQIYARARSWMHDPSRELSVFGQHLRVHVTPTHPSRAVGEQSTNFFTEGRFYHSIEKQKTNSFNFFSIQLWQKVAKKWN